MKKLLFVFLLFVAVGVALRAQTVLHGVFNAETSGDTLRLTEKLVFVPAVCQNATPLLLWSTPTADAATAACNTGTNLQKATLDFADSATQSAQLQTWLPADWTGAIDARIRWFSSATSGDAIWSLATACRADAETSDPVFNTASTVTDTAKGTTLQDNDAAITGLTTTGCAAGEMLYLRVFRDPSGSDTLAATASLRALELTIRRAM